MKVLIVEPNSLPYEANIKGDLHAEQKVVGGLIEPVYMDDGALIICNEEGIMNELPFNRVITQEDDWQHRLFDEGKGDIGIFGTFFICGENGESFSSLSPELMKKYKAKFAQAHDLFRVSPGNITVIKTQAAIVPHDKRLGQQPAKNSPER